MKKMFFVLLVTVSCYGCATLTPTLERQQSLESIKEFPSLKKTELFNRSYSWVARTYNSANNVIQLKDSETGQIICKGIGSASFDFGFQRHFKYTMIIDIKDNKIRTRYENIQSEQVGDVGGPDMKSQWNKVEKYFRTLSENLFNAISNIGKEKDW